MHKTAVSYWNMVINAGRKFIITLGLSQKRDPVSSPEELRRFVQQRAKYMAQTTLYGYLKTRAGTRYTSLFEDEVFVESINIAKWEIYFACVSDLVVYSVARLGHTAQAAPDEMAAIAEHLVVTLFREEDEAPNEFAPRFAKAEDAFLIRAKALDWTGVDDREKAFGQSPQALIEWAPIAPQLKEFDTEIVINSMRFKWKHVRDEVRDQMQSAAVVAAWRAGKGCAPQPVE